MAQDKDLDCRSTTTRRASAAFLRKVTAQFEDQPLTPRPREPQDEKPARLVAAEADLFRCEIAMRLTKPNCQEPAQ